MNEEVKVYIAKYNDEIQQLFLTLREHIMNCTPDEIKEKLWAKIPSYYLGERFIRLIPFQDHINIEAAVMLEHKGELSQFKMTPKGMLQIYLNQPIPTEVLSIIFKETLLG